AIPIGAVAGVIVVLGVYAIDKWIDDPVGALSAHGLAGVWGTLSCGIFTHPSLAAYNAVGRGGLIYTGSFRQLGAQALGVVVVFAFVFVVSYATMPSSRSVRTCSSSASPRFRSWKRRGRAGRRGSPSTTAVRSSRST